MDIASLENKNIKISVIIPVYNVEKYLRQCLDSVINQTYKNLEIICIDDCSTDNSFQILKEYEKKDDRIKIYKNDQNIKAGLTRNRGLKLATGEYIHFLDSDDWLELDAYEKLVQHLQKIGEIDILHFYWKNINALTGDTYVSTYDNSKLLNRIVNIHEHTDIIDNFKIYAWSKLFCRRFLQGNNIKFNNYPYAEDWEFSILGITKAKSIYFLPDVLYLYRMARKDSLTSNEILYYNYVFKSIINSYEYFTNIDKQAIINFYKFCLPHLYRVLWKSFSQKTLDFKNFREMVKELDEKILQNRFTKCQWYIYYKDIINNPEWLAVLKYYSRKFTREHMPFINKILRNIRQNIKLLGKI